MRKITFYLLISSFLFITACSSGSSKFTNTIEKVNALMNDMEYEEALTILDDLENNVVPGDTYESGRMKLIDQLKEETEYMIEHMEELTESFEASMDLYEQAKQGDLQNLEQYKEAISSLEQTIDKFKDLTQLDMYQELTEAQKELVQNIDKRVEELDQNLTEHLEALEFTLVDQKFSTLEELHKNFPSQIEESFIDQTREEIQTEKDRFVFLPEQAVKWDAMIYENDEGSIEIKGVREIDDSLELIVSFKEYYQPLSNKVRLNPEWIHLSGDVLTSSIFERRILPEETLIHYRFSIPNEFAWEDIVRMDFELPFIDEESIQIAADDLKEEEVYEIPGIKAIKNTFTPKWTIENKDYDIVINELIVDNYEVEIDGFVKPNKDLTVNEASSVYLPFSDERITEGAGIFGSNIDKDLYKNTELEFHFTYNLNQPISEHNDIMHMMLYEEQITIDLETGEIQGIEKPSHLMNVYNRTSDTSIGYHSSDQLEHINQDGDRLSNESMMFHRNHITNEYYLLKDFDTFRATIHAHKDFSGKDYGTTDITFYATSLDDNDQEELEEITVKHNTKNKEIEIDVSDVEILVIDVYRNWEFGSNKRQRAILENPIVE